MEAGDLARTTFDLVALVSRITSVSGLSRKFSDFISPLGYTHYACMELRAPGGRPAPRELYGHLDPGWKSRYLTREYHRHDAVLVETVRGPNAMFWSDIKRRRPLTPREQRVFDEVGEFGVVDGFFAPVHNLNGSLSVISLFGRDIDRSPDARTAVEICAYAFAGAARRLAWNDGDVFQHERQLTRMQRECVRWVTSGKTLDETGTILGISHNTVRRHIADAKHRLGVATLPQLAVEATRMGELEW